MFTEMGATFTGIKRKFSLSLGLVDITKHMWRFHHDRPLEVKLRG